jgi:hypothetical protein
MNSQKMNNQISNFLKSVAGQVTPSEMSSQLQAQQTAAAEGLLANATIVASASRLKNPSQSSLLITYCMIARKPQHRSGSS